MSTTEIQTIMKRGRGRKRKDVATDAGQVATTTGLPEQSQVGAVDEAACEEPDDPVVNVATDMPPAGASDSSAAVVSPQVGTGDAAAVRKYCPRRTGAWAARMEARLSGDVRAVDEFDPNNRIKKIEME